MAVVKWVFFDPQTSDTYVFAINPNSGGSPQYVKKLAYQATSASDGQTIAYEGQDEPKATQFSGTVLDKAQYDAMVTWFSKRHVIQVTDDLNRQMDIYITSFEPQRQRAVHYPWKHTYTVKYLVLSISEPTIE